ncbi:MAG: hypothetical protein KAW93_02020 [Methanogenium sp.]|nr:hypothetical protein [Methanogenium sp.]
MKKIGLMLIALAMIIPFAMAATEFGTDVIDSDGGYTVTWLNTDKTNDYQVKTVYETIKAGETDWISKPISGYYTQLHIDLNWGDTSDSLRLKIYSPDGNTFGYYYDNSDGSTDGRIQLNINNQNGIAEGTWWYEVYGYRVTGEEDYYI